MRRVAIRLLTPTGAMRAAPAILTTGFGMVLALLLMFSYVQQVDARNRREDIQRSREICGLIKLSDDLAQKQASATSQPNGPAADDIARYRVELHAYRLKLGCDQK